MKKIIAFFLCMNSLFIFAQNFEGVPSGKERIASSSTQFEQEVLDIVNKIRKRKGKKALKWDDSLAYAARYHAMDMAKDRYFDHNSKDLKKNGKHKKVCDVFERMGKFVSGKVFMRAENIAAGDKTPQQVVKGWMTSKGHRINILDKKAKYLGVGYIQLKGSVYGSYWVQNFGM